MSTSYSRIQYMNGEVSHNEYYGQFCSNNLIEYVVSAIGADRIKNSTDKHFNDIPLKNWDALHGYIRSMVGFSIRKANGHGAGVSLSDCVCVAKQAARIYKESN